MTYIDYLMLTPLDEEWRFVKDVLVKKPFEGSEDSITYYRWQHVCSKNQKRGQYLMVAAPMGKMGLANAANFAATALHTWNPKHVVLLGIAGSLVGEELPLGDVIVPYHTFGYEVAEVN
jgi:nucleoside phosphorylase